MTTIDDIARDLRFAGRSLLRTPVLSGAAVLSIALGIAATTAVFSVVDAALFRPPPYAQPDRLVALYTTRQTPNAAPEKLRWSWARLRLLQRMAPSFEQIASFSQSVLAITSDEPEPVNAEIVSSSYFATMRVAPLVGRAFDPEDDEPQSTHPVALIGYDLWRRRFGADAAVVGRTIGVNGVTLAVAGVMPRGFTGLTGRAQLWLPPTMPGRLSYAAYQTTNQDFISAIGRLRQGVSVERARAELAVVGADIQREVPSTSSNPDARFAATAVPLAEARIDPSTRVPMLLLLAAAGCLLLLACANVAGLLLGRAVSRRREIAIRVATGASRGRVVRQLLVEAGLLAAAGGALGVLVAVPVTMRLGMPSAAWRGRNFYGALSEFALPRVDARVIAFSLAVCALTALAFGLLPALRATRVDLTGALKSGAGDAGQRAGGRVDARRFIVAAETAIAMVLLVSGGLLAASWRRLATTDTGFDRTHLLTFLIRPSEAVYPPAKAPALIARVLESIERLPNVDAATVDGCAPVGTGCANSTLYIMGRPTPRPGEAPPVLRHYVGPNAFRTLGVPILRGRPFDDRDRAGTNRVAIINELAARRFWPDEDPIGKRVWFGGGSNFDRPDSSAEIVGIVGNVAYQSLDERPFQPDFYTPFSQFTYASRTVLVRTRGDPIAAVPDVRRALRAVDPNLAMFDVRAMDDLIGDSWARLTYQTKILTAFALAALLLAATGIFAIIAHVIGDRRREIGIRVALGATPVQVLAAVGGHGARPAAMGLAAGTAIALLVGRMLASAVFGVRAADPAVLSAVLLLVVVVSALSTVLAARRALSVDPAESLKAE